MVIDDPRAACGATEDRTELPQAVGSLAVFAFRNAGFRAATAIRTPRRLRAGTGPAATPENTLASQ
ncbi:MAG: hypothetical protein EP329_14875 [Deltaproteobacteria bacterium]|nr:MAG: hypothetical protein EP329_14875 [Deltaproteobacteria bacterium]